MIELTSEQLNRKLGRLFALRVERFREMLAFQSKDDAVPAISRFQVSHG